MEEPKVQNIIEKPKRVRKAITDKQRAARLENLKKGRETRMAKIQAKKAKKNPIEYNTGSESESSESDPEIDFDSYVLSRKSKPKKTPEAPASKPPPEPDDIRKEMQELREIMFQLAKQTKKRKPRKEKIVLLPPQEPVAKKKVNGKQSPEYSASVQRLLDALKR